MYSMRIVLFSNINARNGVYQAMRLCALLFMAHDAQLALANAPDKETVPVTVRVEAKPDPVRAVGIVFSTKSSQPISETKINKIGDKLFEIQFAVPRSDIQKDSVATAIAYDEAGNMFFGNVTPTLLEDTRDILSSIPECPSQKADQAALLNGPGTLKQLVDFRAQRVDLLRLRINRAMEPSVLAKLQKFEEAFGLKRSLPLSSDLPAPELIDRLSRLQHGLKKFQMEKGKSNK